MKFRCVSVLLVVLALALGGCCGDDDAQAPSGAGEAEGQEAPATGAVDEAPGEAGEEGSEKKKVVRGPVALEALEATDLQEILRRKRWTAIGDPSTSEDRDIRGVSFVVRKGKAKGTVALYTYKSVALAKVFATNLERNNTAVRRVGGKVLAVRIEGDQNASRALLDEVTVSP